MDHAPDAETHQAIFTSVRGLPNLQLLKVKLHSAAPTPADAAALPALSALADLFSPCLTRLNIDVQLQPQQVRRPDSLTSYPRRRPIRDLRSVMLTLTRALSLCTRVWLMPSGWT